MANLLRPVKDAVKQTSLWPLLRPRRFHAYGVGASKTGTTSIARMFSDKYRTGHEHHLEKTVSLVRGKMSDTLSRGEIIEALRERENQMRLELESNSLLAYISGELAELFPEAKFILTVRDPYNWLSSNLKQHVSSPYSQLPSPYKKARDVRKELYDVLPEEEFPRQEENMKGKGVWNIEACLRYWRHQNQVVLDSVPRDRLLVIRTSDISSSLERVADFLEIPSSALSRGKSHANASQKSDNLLDEIDEKYVESLIDQYCGRTIETLNERMEL